MIVMCPLLMRFFAFCEIVLSYSGYGVNFWYSRAWFKPLGVRISALGLPVLDLDLQSYSCWSASAYSASVRNYGDIVYVPFNLPDYKRLLVIIHHVLCAFSGLGIFRLPMDFLFMSKFFSRIKAHLEIGLHYSSSCSIETDMLCL